MFLREKNGGHMVEVLNFNHLNDLYRDNILGRSQYGEEAQEPDNFKKEELEFLSGEALPRCWTDPQYRGTDLTEH
jgi:hypothetical protein